MSILVDRLVLKTALLAIEAMEGLDRTVADADVGELYVTGELLVQIDGQAIGRVINEGDFWLFKSTEVTQ